MKQMPKKIKSVTGAARDERPSRSLLRSLASLELLAPVGVLVVAAVFIGFNMFHFPNYELDEGTYMGSAWAMFEQGKLAYYTYTYDHPVFGWFQIGAWAELIGGFLAFGTSVNTGRALMLVVAALSALLVYGILRRVSGRVVPAVFGAVVFAVSPLAVQLHRQVWIDNLMTFWLLVSLYALIVARGRLWVIIASSLAFALAFWSKEIAVVFLPAMLYVAFVQTDPAHRRFAFPLWGAVTAFAVSLFVVLSLLKDEFLPPGVLWSSSDPHVSLINTYIYQAQRGGGGSIFTPDSSFRTFFDQWLNLGPFLMIGGLAAAALGLLFFKRDRFYFGVSLLVLSFMGLLVRGGIVLFFYVIPLLALLALALGLLASHVMGLLERVDVPGAVSRLTGGRLSSLGRVAALAVLGLAVFVGVGAVPANGQNFNGDATTSQTEATRWIVDNLPNESVILMDAYSWTDLRAEELVGDEPFESAHYPLTALQDPSIFGQTIVSPGDIDYLLYSPTNSQSFSWIDGRLNQLDLPLVSGARESSDSLRTFTSPDWEMELLRVRNLHQIEAPDDPLLANTWESYKDRFVEDERVVDPKASNRTTSEGQAYAMLRSVYMDDKEAFDRIWDWTQENLQVRSDDYLLAWTYGKEEGVTDQSTAADADTDAALALLFADQRWGGESYESDALRILDDVWDEETLVAGDNRVLVAGDWATGGGDTDGPVVNPSYLSPYAYKIFAEADPDHAWDNLVDGSYETLQAIQSSPDLGGDAGIVPNWVALDAATGEPSPADNLESFPTDDFSFDAIRVPWRIGLDYMWFADDRALEVLENLSLPRDEVADGGTLYASYDLNGEPLVDYESVSTYAGVLPSLLVGGDPALAHTVFTRNILGAYNEGEDGTYYWGEDPDDYYAQNLAWFATAVMDGSMSNLYAGEESIEWEKTSIPISLADQQDG